MCVLCAHVRRGKGGEENARIDVRSLTCMFFSPTVTRDKQCAYEARDKSMPLKLDAGTE